MALESGTYIDSLNSSNPASTDALSAADDHLRLIKSTIKASFPGVTGAVTATHAELNILDGVTSTAAELNILDGVTSTAAELNILDGVTSTAAELNLLNGVTATTAELNYVDGVTSAIQTQLDAKQASNDILSDLAGLTQATNKVPYFSSATAASVLDFLDEDDMSSNSATAVPSQQSVKAYVDAAGSIGVGQTWQSFTTGATGNASFRNNNEWYQNTSSSPIQVAINLLGGTGSEPAIYVGTATNSYVTLATWDNDDGSAERFAFSFIVPVNHYYKLTSGTRISWSELRA